MLYIIDDERGYYDRVHAHTFYPPYLRAAGGDGLFDTGDDDVYDLRVWPDYGGGTTINLRLFDGPLHEGHYRLTITRSTPACRTETTT